MLRPAVLILICCAAAARADGVLAVNMVEVARKPLTFDSTLTGTIEARDSVDLGFRQGGKVTEVLVSAGDRVRAGQPLARVDSLQQDQALRVAQAALASAQASLQQATQAAERASAMLARGVGTRAARDAANDRLSAAQGGVERAESAVGQAQRAVDDTTLTAPADAVVTQRNLDPGQIVGAAQVVLSLAQMNGLEAVFQTPDSPRLNSAMGAKVTLEPIDIDAPAMTGHVTEIAPLVNPNTGSVTVTAVIDGHPTEARLLGAAVSGTVHYPVGQGMSVPWTALSALGDQPAVWVVGAESTVDLVPVVIERFTTGDLVLKSGVRPGQLVVTDGSQMLYPGRKVERAQTQ